MVGLLEAYVCVSTLYRSGCNFIFQMGPDPKILSSIEVKPLIGTQYNRPVALYKGHYFNLSIKDKSAELALFLC